MAIVFPPGLRILIATVRGHRLPAARREDRSGAVGRSRAHLKLPIGAGDNSMHEAHRRAAEQHELAAQAHRTAAEHNEKGDLSNAVWHSQRAMEYSDHAFKLAKEADSKSGQ